VAAVWPAENWRSARTARALPAEAWYPTHVTTTESSSPPGAPHEASAGASAASEPAAPADVVLIHGVTPDGEGLQVLRRRDGQIEAGAARPLKHGQPIQGEVVRLKPHKEFPLLCDVEVELPGPKLPRVPSTEQPRSRKGPARVATERYRENWDAIWARPKKDEPLLN
jgi:hypothetical protein